MEGQVPAFDSSKQSWATLGVPLSHGVSLASLQSYSAKESPRFLLILSHRVLEVVWRGGGGGGGGALRGSHSRASCVATFSDLLRERDSCAAVLQ